MSNDPVPASEGVKERADRRFTQALTQHGLPDPRDRYRAWLRKLRGQDESAFRMALEYFEQRVAPRVAAPESDPVVEWTEYGLRLAQRVRPGAPVRIDTTGRSHDTDASAPLADLVLHLPTSAREAALAVRLPARLSPAQQATYELLVRQGGEAIDTAVVGKARSSGGTGHVRTPAAAAEPDSAPRRTGP